MKATLRKYGILLATLLSVAFSFNYSNAQITGASTVCVNGSTTLVAPATTISGGTITNVSGYNVHTFTGAGTFVIPAGMNINTELLVVAGGGGGGKRHAGGGGAGGLIYSASYNTSGSQSVVIGAGGQGSVLEPNNGLNGGNSVFGSVVATGGGGGGTNNINANSGGSGGGGSNGSFGGAGIVGQGFAGGNQNNGLGCCYAMGNGGGGATGAGASTAGLAGSNGGPGFTTSMTGVSQSFAGGGGGGQGLNITTNYLGGIGGGGMGGNALNMQGANGTANTGGGGGGGGATDFTSGNGGNGGSGIVIVKYAQAGAGTWSSSNIAVATVNASTGAVTGVSAGSATITYTVTVGGVVNTFTKVITVNGLPVASIKPSGALAFCAGGNVTLSAATSALQFNGSNSVSVASGFAATDDITYEATVTPTSLSGFNVIMNHDNYNTGAIHYQFVNGQLQFSVAGNAPNDQYCSAAFAANTTYRVAAVYSKAGKYVKFYVNGVLINTAIYSSTVSIIGNNSYTIGAWGGGRFFQGTIDDIRVWNVQRTDAQVLSDAAALPIATGTANLIRYYRFDEGTGITTSDDAGGATGTLVGSPVWVSTTPVGQTYLWSNGSTASSISVTTAGTYTVIVTNASGCVSTSEAKTIKVNAVPAASIVAGGSTTFCPGGSVLLTGAGSAGNALQLSGANYAEIINNNLPLGTAARTLEAWVKTTQTSGGAIANWGVISSGQRFGLLVISGKLYFVGQNVDMIGNITINDGVWHHVAVTYNGTTVTTYVDGVQDATGNLGLNTSGTTLRIGQRSIGDNGNELFVGQIDEVRVWNIAKTITQIQATQKLSVATNSANLVAYYKMNEASGTTIADATSNAVTANLIGSPTFATSGADIRYNTYSWSNSATTNSITVNATGNYSYSATTADGCSVSATATTVTVNPLPTATITGATNVCINTGSPLVTFTGANGTAPYTFTYSINAGAQQTVTSTGNIATVSAPTGVVGTFTYTLLSVKDASTTTCSNTITGSSIVVVVRAIPTISGITGTTSICPGNSTILTAASASVGANYKWYDAASGGNLLASGATYTTGAISSTTNYYVELTAAPNVCAATRTLVTVTISDVIAPTFTSVQPNITASATSANGAVVTYTLPTAIDNCTASPIVTAIPASGSVFPIGTTQVTVTATDATGNSVNTSFNVIVSGAAPVIVAPVNSTLNAAAGQCSATATFAATETTGIPASTITYTENGNTISSGTALSVGVHTITATATNAVGVSTGTFTVTVKDVQAPSFSGGTSNAPASILANVPEASQYQMVYQLNVPNAAQWSSQAQIPYTVNNAAALTGATFNRVAYYMELDNGKWVWVSMDKFTSDPSLIGIPTGATVWQQKVNNMNVFASANAGVTTGTNIATGNIEFWSHCYNTANTLGLPGANASTYDFDDQITTQNCYGSFQVHNYGAQQTLFAYNRWAGGGNSDIGIGNNTGQHPDWTFMSNAPSVSNKKIYVFISGGVIADINANTDLGACSATINVPTPTANDFCGTTTVTGVRSDALALTAAYPKGTTTITWTATDASSNSTTTSQKVIVADNEAPKVAGPADISVNATSAAGAVVSYATPTATDNCPSVSIVKTAGLASGSTFPIGVSTIIYKATDAAGLTATYTFTVTVSGLAPVIVKPADIAVNSPANQCGTTVSFAATETTGIPASVITYSEDGSVITSGANFSVGIHTITATATNAVSTSSTTFTITVSDVTPPVFTSTASIVTPNVGGVVLATSAAGAIVNYSIPTATDNCSSNVTVTAVPASGSVFAIGNTTVTVTATDVYGNSAQTSFVVTVAGLAPVITVPANSTIDAGATSCSATAIFAATETTGIPASIITYTENGLPISSGATLSVGVHTITAKATNTVGSSSGTFTITVKDVTAPIIATVADIIANAGANCNAVVSVVAPTATDNCLVNANALNFDGANDFVNIPRSIAGDFTIEFWMKTTQTGGNGSQWYQGIGVVDAEVGGVTSDFGVSLVGSKIAFGVGAPDRTIFSATAVNSGQWVHVAATRQQATGLMNLYVNGILQSSTIGGTNLLTAPPRILIGLMQTGANGFYNGSLSGIRLWSTVRTASEIASNMNASVPAQTGLVANYDCNQGVANGVNTGINTLINKATSTNNGTLNNFALNGTSSNWISGQSVSSVTLTNSFNGTANASGTYPLGVTNVIWTATDASGNSSTYTQKITVKDVTAPSINSVANINAIATSASGAVVTYTAPVGIDNCSGVTTIMTAGLASGSIFPIGTTVVTYTVTDAAGLTASTSFNVTVTGLAPVIVTPGDIVVNNDPGMNGAVVNYAATETTAIPASTITYSIAPGSFFAIGTTTVTATASNAVGTSSVDFNVVVVDHEKPTIATATNINATNDENKCAATVTVTAPAASDNAGIASVIGVRSDELALTDAYPVGTTTITWTATDIHGNINSSTQTITVTDTQLPTITAPANVTVTANAGVCSASNVALGNAVTADNCAVASVTNNALPAFPVGTTTVTWTVTDIHGNVSTATQDVTVTDDELPVIINTPINITQSNDQGNCGAVVIFAAATATDNCPGVTISSDHQSGETFPVGTTTVTYTATDAHAHTVTSSFTITVNDTELPTITTTDKTQTADAGVCKATVTVAAPVTADNCAVQSVTNSINGTSNASAVYPVGTTQITWTVTDIHGNVNTTVQNITVNDEEKPIAKTQDITIQLNANGSASITPAQINNGSTDNCGIASITLDKTSFYCSNVGANIVTLTVTDIHGNTSSATATVTVQDKVAPIAKAKNITVGLGTQVGGLVTITAAQVDNGSTDACGIASMTVVPASFGCSKVGANTVTLTVTDVNGNSSITTAVVTIVDDKGPVPTVNTLPTITGQCYATALTLKPGEHEEDHDGDDNNRIEMDHYYLVVPTAMDNCSGLAKGTTTDPLTYYNQGTYIIHWKYVDAKGNVTIQEQTVIVKDTQAPTPKRATLPTIAGQCSVSIASGHDQDHDDEDEYEGDDNDHHDGDNDHDHWNQHHSGAPWAKDNCSGWIKGTTTDPLTYSVQGTYIIHWTFDDGHGNISTQTQTVIVKDVTAPRALQNNLPTITGQCSATVTTAPTAMDNCVGLVTGTTTDPLTYNAPGTYTIHWTYSDGRGNTSTQNQQVVVRDNIKPIITAPANVTGLCVGMSTDPSATGTATATDNCSGIVSVTYTDQKSGSTSINRTWKATDASGNTATAVQQISFSAAYTASITSVPTSNVNTGGSSTSLFLGYGAQSTALTVTGLPSSGAPYTYQWTGIAMGNLNSTSAAAPVFTPTAAGNYQFTVTVTNKNGCTANASINICVKDIRVPGSNGTKVYVCHTGNGKSSTTQTLEVLISQVASHINGNCGSRGNDVLGSCNQGTCDPVAPVVNAVDPKTQDVVEMKTMKSDVTAAPVEDLKVTVMPNPSTTYFTLKFETKDQKTAISLRVMDASGRAIDSKQQIEPSNTIQIGHNYPSGTFFAEVIQGNKRKVVQLIKARG